MDWPNERYVRVYTRDTTDMLLWSWQARTLWWDLLRKFSRAGVLDLGRHGLKGILAHIRTPWDVVEPAIKELLDDGCVAWKQGKGGRTYLLARSFVEANEAAQSDRMRQQALRERRRDAEQLADLLEDPEVTTRDGAVAIRDADVTPSGHEMEQVVTETSRPLTSSHSVPSVPSVPSQKDNGSTNREEAIPMAPLKLLPTEPPGPAFDFEALYRRYPRKEGKQKGLDYCEETITTAAQYEALSRSIANYAAQVQGKDPQYTKHFSSFMRCWRDYIDAPAPAPRPVNGAPVRAQGGLSDLDLRRMELDARRAGLVDAEGNPL